MSSGRSPTPEIEVERSAADRYAMMLIASSKPPEQTARENANEPDSPNSNHSKNCDGLSIALNDSEWPQEVPQRLGDKKIQEAEQEKKTDDQLGQPTK